MKSIFLSFLSLMMVAAASPALAWTEVAYETVFADAPTFQQIVLRKSNTPYREVMIQVMNPSGARIQRAEVITQSGWSRPAWMLEGDYRFGMQRTAAFEPANMRFVRMYLVSLRRGEPVRLRILMR